MLRCFYASSSRLRHDMIEPPAVPRGHLHRCSVTVPLFGYSLKDSQSALNIFIASLITYVSSSTNRPCKMPPRAQPRRQQARQPNILLALIELVCNVFRLLYQKLVSVKVALRLSEVRSLAEDCVMVMGPSAAHIPCTARSA